MRMRYSVVLFVLPVFAADSWFARVEPLMSSAEKKSYGALTVAERPAFETQFWNGRLITQDEYLRRATYVDEMYGSGKAGSGANTDRGRVQLSLGPPNRVTRLASSRTFFPMEVWYYSEAPNLDIHYELQLLFFQRNGTGEYKLYSPTLNTIKDLMNPQSSTRGLFGVNDIVTESDIRTRLTLSPAESEVIDAAVAVARGIKGMGNEQILAMVASPARALSRENKARVTARLVTDRPALTTFQSQSADGIPQVDLAIEPVVRNGITLEVQQGNVTLERFETSLHFNGPRQIRYEQRLHLLGGDYRIMVTADGRTYPYSLTVAPAGVSGILTGTLAPADRPHTPFEFRGSRLDTSAASVAVVHLAKPGAITWRLRRGVDTLWFTKTNGEGTVVQNIGDTHVPPGAYTLEAAVNGEVRTVHVRLGSVDAAPLPIISYNANLDSAARYRSLGHQWLARGDAGVAKVWLQRAWSAQPDIATKIELCRVDALMGRYDDARAGLDEVLKQAPDAFEALSALAYVEVGLQDYAVAEKLYARALTIQKSPAIENALKRLQARK